MTSSRGNGDRQSPDSAGSRPRGGYIVLGFVIFCGGCVLSLVNYSNNAVWLYLGIGLVLLGIGIAWFSPSRRRNGNQPPNGHERA